MKRLTAALAAIALAGISLATFAAQDESQRQITQRIQQQKLKLAAAEQAQGAERDKLMDEHMKLMQDTMGRMQAMKPRAGMTPKEQNEWIEEHQKLMEQIMGQMMAEHHLMMQRKPGK